MARFFVFLLSLLLLSQPSLAHDWYPLECCSEKDCEPMSATDLERDGDEWILPNGERIHNDFARESRDHQFHWCRYIYHDDTRSPVIRPFNRPICFFVPTGGT